VSFTLPSVWSLSDKWYEIFEFSFMVQTAHAAMISPPPKYAEGPITSPISTEPPMVHTRTGREAGTGAGAHMSTNKYTHEGSMQRERDAYTKHKQAGRQTDKHMHKCTDKSVAGMREKEGGAEA
jgi:hypothetical protein